MCSTATSAIKKRLVALLRYSILLSVAIPASAQENTADADSWRAYMELLAPVGERVAKVLPEPDNPQLRQEMHRQLFSLIAAGYWGLLYSDADNPDFIPFWYNFGAPNPDDLYKITRIDSGGTYRITGVRSTVRIMTFSIGSGPFYVDGTGKQGPNLAEYDIDKMHLQKNGAFEIILSAARPKGYNGNWWYLDPRATNILVRQRFYDWINEQAGPIAIQRLDRPAGKSRRNADQLAANMRQMAAWTEAWAKWSIEFANRSRRLGYVNKVEVNGLHESGGYAIQSYIMGLWDIAPDEALIYETEVPKSCRYWGIQLVDELYAALDRMNLSRQTSLNGFTARVDNDGKFRAVISAQDPGVSNWLDTAGYQRGGIFGRWQECPASPTPTVTKVKVADVRKYLPADTPEVSAGMRETVLRKANEAMQLRRRW